MKRRGAGHDFRRSKKEIRKKSVTPPEPTIEAPGALSGARARASLVLRPTEGRRRYGLVAREIGNPMSQILARDGTVFSRGSGSGSSCQATIGVVLPWTV